MKNLKLGRLIVSFVLFLVFAAVSAGLFFMAIAPDEIVDDIMNNGGVIFNKDMGKVYDFNENEELTDEIKKIELSLEVGGFFLTNEVNISANEDTDDDNVYFSVNGIMYDFAKKDFSLDLSAEGDTLKAEAKYDNNPHWWIPVYFSFFIGEIELKVPASFTGELIVNCTSENLTVDIPNVLSGLDISVTSGTVYLNEISVQNSAKIKLTSGDVICDKMIAKDAEINVTSGTVLVNSLECRNLKTIVVSGTANIKGDIEKKAECSITSGTVSITLFSAADRLDIGVTSGTANVRLAQGLEYSCIYNITSGSLKAHGTTYHHSSGTCDSPDGTGGMIINLNITSGTGNINYI